MAHARQLAIGAAAAAGGAALGAAYAGLVEPRRVKVRRVTLELPDWPRALERLRVAVVSDLHAGGPHVGPERVAQVVARVNGEHPDLVALLGDYVDPDVHFGDEVDPAVVADRLAGLRTPLGVFAVLGNHDWHAGGEQVRRALREGGIEVLENDAAQVRVGDQILWLVGMADATKRDPDPDTAFALVPDRAPLIVLTHDPDVFPHVRERASLTLAGHTHGGQVNVPVLKRRVIPSRHGERYAAGLVEEQGRKLYVTRGVGESMWPVRLGVPPEIVVLTLVSAGQPVGTASAAKRYSLTSSSPARS